MIHKSIIKKYSKELLCINYFINIKKKNKKIFKIELGKNSINS